MTSVPNVLAMSVYYFQLGRMLILDGNATNCDNSGNDYDYDVLLSCLSLLSLL